ncbi:hypothetical protein MKW98_004227 [Papaver atlanticum]|uniref:Uncharacterized protein n=1 Tax=Papaver atlanticum TaxID=357466 RepID=A0AAD4XSI2_9MAGN|nr:hypothetical protein MKW98_004227 [Papaver atlanticum]
MRADKSSPTVVGASLCCNDCIAVKNPRSRTFMSGLCEVDLGIFRASAMDLMLVRLRNGISIILLKSTFLGLGPTLVGFREDTSKGSEKRCKGPSYNEFFITVFRYAVKIK